jgi:hypothetical protein
MSANTSSGTTLSGYYDDTIITPSLPDPDTETEIALVDFTYVESVFKQLKAQYPSYTLNAVQDKLIEALRADNNNAAKKTVALYDSYVEEGMTKSNTFISISSDLNINLKD